jgi:hypothetical protein
MKTNDRILLGSLAAYIYLFYSQNPGINFLIFDIMLIVLFLWRNNMLIRESKWFFAVALCLVSGIAVMINSSGISVFANVSSFILLSALSFDAGSSCLFGFAFGVYSIGTSIIQMVLDGMSRRSRNMNSRSGSAYTFILFAISLIAIIAFFLIYRLVNPIFETNTMWISLKLPDSDLPFFSFGGLLICYGLIHHKTLAFVSSWEKSLPGVNRMPPDPHAHKQELIAGTLLFFILNLMLLVLNFGDINTFWLSNAMPKGVTLSDFVHKGFELVIISILLGMLLILFLARLNLQALSNNRMLKMLLCFWIAQNVLMIASVLLRDHMYVQNYGLTHKRVVVFVWALLACAGLGLIFYKIIREKSNWYFIRSGFVALAITIVCVSVPRWEIIITRYNLGNLPAGQIDYEYLMGLGNSNIPDLMQAMQDPAFKKINGHQRLKERMVQKIFDFMKGYSPAWQSWNFKDYCVSTCLAGEAGRKKREKLADEFSNHLSR